MPVYGKTYLKQPDERLKDFKRMEDTQIKVESAEMSDEEEEVPLPPLIHCPLYPRRDCAPSSSDLPFTITLPDPRITADIPILETLSNIVGSLFKSNNKIDKRKSVEVQTLCPGSEASRFRPVKQKICNQCNKAFSQKMHLQRHIKSVHDVIRDNFCTFCGKGFTLKSHLMEHIRAVHFKIKNRVCPICDWKFHRQGDLNRHVKAVHREGKTKKYSRKKQKLEEPIIKTELQENTVVNVDGINGDKEQVLECLEVYASRNKLQEAPSVEHNNKVLQLLENALLDYNRTKPVDQGIIDCDVITGATSTSIENAGIALLCNNADILNSSKNDKKRVFSSESTPRVKRKCDTFSMNLEGEGTSVAFPLIHIEIMQTRTMG